jgi:hypothetical protein
VKLKKPASGVTRSRRGMGGSTASYTTKFTGSTAVPTITRTAAGHATTAIGLDTLARSFHLSDAEKLELVRLQNIRRRGMMLSMSECDWLLNLYWRLKG